MIQRFGQLMGILVTGMLLWLPVSLLAQDQESVTVHVVQRGETLYQIALEYDLSIADIATFNGIADPTNILVGQRLLIPLSEAVVNQEVTTHVVQPGETLRRIADLYGLTVSELAERNNITDINTIYVGQVLALIADTTIETESEPTTAPTAVPAPEPVLPSTPDFVYTVQSGDTLFKIATRFGSTVGELSQVNAIGDPTLIYVGQQLLIPGVEIPDLALDLPSIVSGLTIQPLVLVEGQTAEIRISTISSAQITGSFLDRNITAATNEDGLAHTILVGIPVFTEAGIYPLRLEITDTSGQATPIELNMQILAGGYGRESITLAAGLEDLLDPNVENAELEILRGIMSRFTPTRYFTGPMGLPAAARITSPFGRGRSYNGGPITRYHQGTDFGGAPGTPILAPAPGVVVMVDALNVRGNATIIDHGWGVFTGYWHQTQSLVSVGDTVVSGQTIGTVGSTGRVSGPHLHWELWVNGVPVDPMQWTQTNFAS
jgi:murein DD-endopeptidase MepM/ murein hydrolase activator NlpD